MKAHSQILNTSSARPAFGLLLAFGLQLPTLCAQTIPPGPELVVYRSISNQPLHLNPERIAGRGLSPESWQAESISPASIQSWPIAGWTLAATPPHGSASPVDTVRALVERLAVKNPSDFASPVFFGLDEEPVVVTPTLLVAFDEFHRGAFARNLLAEFNELQIIKEDWASMPGSYKIRVNSSNGFRVLDIASELSARDGVSYAEPDWMFTGNGSHTPNDALYPQQWGLNNTGQLGGTPNMDINAPEAWDITLGDPQQKVLIIDTGIQQDHPDIQQVPGIDVTSDGPGVGAPIGPWDNHGTVVAGCVSASIDNSVGVVGVAPHSNSVAARTMIGTSSAGSWMSQASWTVDALAYAESIGVRVTNNSNGYNFTSAAIEAKYASTRGAGMIHFASIGNVSTASATYPASLPTVIAIGSITRTGAISGFSNSGPDLAFVAPGSEIPTTDRTGFDGYFPGNYGNVQGTSFASPYCAGVASLLLSIDPSLNADQVLATLRCTSRDLGAPGFDTTFGWGLVDALAAAERVAAKPGALESFGYESFGELSNTPSGGDFVAVAAGGDHSLALRADLSIVSWGRDMEGQVSTTPPGQNFVQVAAGQLHSLALRSDGSIVSWGDNTGGQVTLSPTEVGYTQVAAGAHHSLALRADGSIKAWGLDTNGSVSAAPTGIGFLQVSGGGTYSLALRQDGSVEAWGQDSFGVVSNAPTETGFVSISAGVTHCVALRSDGSTASWGSNLWGESSSPFGTDYFAAVAGESLSVALTSAGQIQVWGFTGGFGGCGAQLQIPQGGNFSQVAAGEGHGVGVRSRSSGVAFCFGDGTGTPCPCGTNGKPGEGCANSTGARGVKLVGFGNAQVSVDSFGIYVNGVPGDKPGLLLRGAAALNGGFGNAVGDGLLCVAGQTARSHIQVTSCNTTTFNDFKGAPFGASIAGLGVPTNYQYWYRDPGNACSGLGFNFSNAWAVTWTP